MWLYFHGNKMKHHHRHISNHFDMLHWFYWGHTHTHPDTFRAHSSVSYIYIYLCIWISKHFHYRYLLKNIYTEYAGQTFAGTFVNANCRHDLPLWENSNTNQVRNYTFETNFENKMCYIHLYITYINIHYNYLHEYLKYTITRTKKW